MKITTVHPDYLPTKAHPKDAAYDLRAYIKSTDVETLKYIVRMCNRLTYNGTGDLPTNYYLNGAPLFTGKVTIEVVNSTVNELLTQPLALLLPNNIITLDTGVAVATENYTNLNARRKMEGLCPLVRCIDIRSRSGLAINHRISVVNSPGLVDSETYRSTIKVGLENNGPNVHFFTDKARIAQMTFSVVEDHGDLSQYLVEELDVTTRKSGLGSTGV